MAEFLIMFFTHTFYVDNQRMAIAISYIMMFTCGLYIGGHSFYLQTPQTYYDNYLTFRGSINQSLVAVSNQTSFYSLGMKYKTDKVTFHRYDIMYEKYLRKYVGTNSTLLEIGLGCNMLYPPGASMYLYRNYLGPQVTLHFLENNRQCAERWYQAHGQKVRDYLKNRQRNKSLRQKFSETAHVEDLQGGP